MRPVTGQPRAQEPALIHRALPHPGTPRSVRVRVPAKVNLHLRVGPRRDDGYHELETVFHAVSLFDDLTASAPPWSPAAVGADTPAEPGLSLTIEGEGAHELPTGKANLVIRAARALADYTGVEPVARLHLRKGIPVAGGMAGGSADAAAALVACDALWGTAVPRAELAKIAASLGSDVPFALAGGTALGTGRGELLTPLLAPGRRHWVIAIADGGLATPAVYAELDRLRDAAGLPDAGPADEVASALRSDDPDTLADALANDLQPAALSLRPELRRTLSAGIDEGALGGLVSGSGPSCFFVAADADHAVRVAAALAGRGVCRTVRTAYGPVPGARVATDAEGE